MKDQRKEIRCLLLMKANGNNIKSHGIPVDKDFHGCYSGVIGQSRHFDPSWHLAWQARCSFLAKGQTERDKKTTKATGFQFVFDRAK